MIVTSYDSMWKLITLELWAWQIIELLEFSLLDININYCK